MKIKNIIIFTALTIASATLMSCSNKNLKIQTEPTSAIEMENTTGMISETNSNSDFESIDGLENVEFENPEFDLDLNENRLTVNGNMSWEMKPDLANVKLVIEKNISDENTVKEIAEKVQDNLIKNGANKEKMKVSDLLKSNEEQTSYITIDVYKLNANEINQLLQTSFDLGITRFEDLTFESSSSDKNDIILNELTNRTKNFAELLAKENNKKIEKQKVVSNVDFGPSSLETAPISGTNLDNVVIRNLQLSAKTKIECSLKDK